MTKDKQYYQNPSLNQWSSLVRTTCLKIQNWHNNITINSTRNLDHGFRDSWKLKTEQLSLIYWILRSKSSLKSDKSNCIKFQCWKHVRKIKTAYNLWCAGDASKSSQTVKGLVLGGTEAHWRFCSSYQPPVRSLNLTQHWTWHLMVVTLGQHNKQCRACESLSFNTASFLGDRWKAVTRHFFGPKNERFKMRAGSTHLNKPARILKWDFNLRDF